MALDPVPWLVAGGAVHSAAVARALAYAAVGGVSGVIEATGGRVQASATPDNRVRVGAGAFSIINTYPGQQHQAYIARNPGDTYIDIAPTSGAGRSDLIVARIDDPEYGGTTPANPANGPYVKLAVISNVGSTAVKAPPSVTYPHVVLARLDIPASTSTITSAMIKDLRRVVHQRTQREVQFWNGGGGQPVATLLSTSGQYWPKVGGFSVYVPDWATEVKVVMTMSGAWIDGDGSGKLWIRGQLNSGDLQNGPNAIFDTNASATGRSRITVATAADFVVPASWRGQMVTFYMMGALTPGEGSPNTDSGTNLVLDATFAEAPAAA